MSPRKQLNDPLSIDKILSTNKILQSPISLRNPLTPYHKLFAQSGAVLQQGSTALSSPRPEKCDAGNCLTESLSTDGNGYDYRVYNSTSTYNYVAVFFGRGINFVPINTGKTVRATNIDRNQYIFALMYEYVLAPGHDMPLVSFRRTDPNNFLRPTFYLVVKNDVGRNQPEHTEPNSYALPFASNNGISISQGFNGQGFPKENITHRGVNRYAVDFPMTNNTPVLAARNGRVFRVKQDSDVVGGRNKHDIGKANYIIIEHNDGTYSRYGHLIRGGARVQIGQLVRAGDHIGCSGNSGYSSDPHLHFEVLQRNFDLRKIDWKPNVAGMPVPNYERAMSHETIEWGFSVDNGQPPRVGNPPYVNPNDNNFAC
ncbi:Murein DD-endopeptidase MepM and murein hydrolase activator NlpD, contain LysM domain [Evansella caseinilytica]|uniref:Murein DD-endopeptidase MepM and murein hydrolase activator NlpD, contain LysM domain n=1 Tax=Evansella caseinilytica TaxID=1503961 RepID=A0A1H3UUY4_9BACI|nr:M23 family metallopeptidase [Evansella caseinilytica]SDZ65619.1 Murein DD-endopeptidase MepM and murein hydrolase activator NlpD, contain LysM domain [Evansella caseinilytica]